MRICVLLLVLTSCASVTPQFRASPNQKDVGYWEETLAAKGAYRIHAVLPAELSDQQKFEYLALRLGELCRAKGMNHFDPVGLRDASVLRLDLPRGTEQLSMLGFCYKENFRRSLGVELVPAAHGLRVKSVLGAPELQSEDEVVAIEKVVVQKIDDVRLATYQLPDTQTKVAVDIVRGEKELTIQCTLQKSHELIYDLRDFYYLQNQHR